MHRSIAGLADAFQSIADAKATLNAKDKSVLRTVSRDVAVVDKDFESNRRMNDASQHYLDMENCTARIAAKLRAMDDLDLNLHDTAEADHDDPDLRVSNQKRFIDDQCHHAQALLSGEYYLRNLHSNEVHKDIMELDERIGYAAKNWKHALIELGINEADLTDLKAPAVEAAQETIAVKSDSRKVRRNTVITPKGAAKADVSMVAVEAEYHGYNVAEFNELNEILTQFMDHAFLNGTNGYELSNEIMARCTRFKNKIIALTNQLIETERRTVKTAIREAQRKVRLLETDLALLHAQHEEADMVMRNQKDADKVIRRLVEEKFKESLSQLNEHHKRMDHKIEAQLETNNVLQKRIAEVHAMFLELQKQRLYADPFVRRRAENIVKGLLANLNEKDLKEQELREQEMSASYQQWKKIMEFCNEKERQLALMQNQEQSLQEEIANQKQRIAKERVIYRERVKVLKSKDEEQSNRLRVLEEKLSEKARDERRKLHFEQRSEAMKQPIHATVSHAMTNIPEGRSAAASTGAGGGGRRPQSRVPRSGNNSDSEGDDDDEFQQGGNAAGSNNKVSDDAGTSESEETESSSDSSNESDAADDALGLPNTASKHVKSKRIKQHGVRTVAPLCDDYTEVLLGVTHEHTKRQEISRTVFTHIPRPVAGHITGSEQSDNALLAKAQKMMSTLHTAGELQEDANKAAANQSEAATAVVTVAVRESEPAWTTQTNSSVKPLVKFGGSSRGQSVSGKVQYGFWADVDPLVGELDDSSSEDGFRGPSAGGAGSGKRKQKAVQVHSLTSTACYVALYYRYLKKFPNLNFKKDNPRLQSPVRPAAPTPLSPVEGKASTSGLPSSRGADAPVAAPPPSELISKNNRFQFTIKEGLVVVKEALDALLQCKVVDKIILTDALAKMSELERRVKLASIPEEEKEVRYQLHYLCVSLIHTVLSRAPRVLLVKNNRKYFVEICSCMLALLGVVLNCTLVFWQPSCLNKSSKMYAATAAGGVVMDRVEFICAHLIELVITLGDVDSARPLSGDPTTATATAATPAIPEHSTRTSMKRSGKNFKVKKQADTPPGPAGFICLLRKQTAELLLRKKNDEKSGSTGSPADASTSKEAASKSAPASQRPGSTIPPSRRGVGVSYHDLFDMFNKIVDDDTPIEGVANEVGTFTMKHRHAILSLQLFLYLSLNVKETPMNEAILILHKGIMDGAASVRADESNVIPCDVDILLQQMHPGMVPAVLTLELIRRVLEAEFERVTFLKKIAEGHHDVADLQFLNVEFAGQFDVSMKTNRELASKNAEIPGKEKSDRPEGIDGLSLVIPVADHGAAHSTSAAPASPRRVNPLHITRFKTTRAVHAQWVEDLEFNLRQLSSEVTALIKPPSSNIGMREPCFAPDGTDDTNGAPSLPSSQKVQHPAIPLPDILVYQILAHVNSLRSITAAHSIHGLARVETLQPAFVQIMRDLLAARSRITAIVTAMTWPMRKKLEWLKLKYNTLLEDNALANQQVTNFKDILQRYKKDIETYKTSIAQVEREKHSIEYRHTKILILGRHDPQVQELIVEHATDEYLQKLTEFKARETRLNGTIAQFSSEYEQLNTQGETLKAAHQSLGLIDKAQDTADAAAEARHKHDEHAGPGFGAHFGLEGMDGLSGFDQYRGGVGNLNIHQAPMVPAGVSELLNAVDQFVHTTRLAEAINPKTLKDPPPKNQPNAKKVVASALAADLARHKLKNIASKVAARPKLPLFGMSAALQPRDEPTVPPKLFGFAKRIEGGLQAVSAFKSPAKQVVQAQQQTQQSSVQQPAQYELPLDSPLSQPQRAQGWSHLQVQGLQQAMGSPGSQPPPQHADGVGSPPGPPVPYVPYTPTNTHIEDHGLFQPSTSTVFSLGSGAGTHAPGAHEMSDELDDGPHAPVRGVYTGGLGKEGDSVDMFGQKASPTLRDRIGRSFLRKSSRRRNNPTKMGRFVDQFMLSSFGGRDFYREDLLRPALDSPLMTPDLPDSEMTDEQRAEWRRIARLNVRGDPITVVFTKKPDLEHRKTLAFMEPLQRAQPFRYDDLVEEDLRSNFTPLNIRKLIDQLREAQQKEIEARKLADPNWQPAQHGARDGDGGAAGDEERGARPGGIEFDDELEDDDFDIREADEGDEQGGDRTLAGSVSTNKFGGGSSRDQNVGTGVTYAEYLMWKNKRKQQKQGEQQLEALKNSLNIQLRNARRVVATEVTEQEADAEVDDSVLTEQQFAELGGDHDVVKAVSEASQPSMSRDYSSTNTEVDFILSRSNSRLDAIGALKRKFSSKKRTSVGSALHFNASALNNTDGDGGSATVEAGRRARGESMMSARASLSMRARASLLVKLHRALDTMEGRADDDAAADPGGLNRRARSRMSMSNKLTTISERSARSSLVCHSSMIKAPPVPELKLNDARDIANSIIHGKPMKEASEKKERRGKAVDTGFDMQILEYIANDQLIMSGWESVDLFKMNDNETFSGHSFKFDDQEDKLRVSTLREFTQSVASSAEESASAVENEFRAAIVNLNRLVGKKISDTAVLDAPPQSAEEVAEEAGAEQESRQTEGVGARSGSDTSAMRRESHLQPHERRVSHMSTNRSTTGFSRSNSAAEGDLPVGAAGVDGEPPHRPQEPKPSATFASPRRKIFLAEPSSLVL